MHEAWEYANPNMSQIPIYAPTVEQLLQVAICCPGSCISLTTSYVAQLIRSLALMKLSFKATKSD